MKKVSIWAIVDEKWAMVDEYNPSFRMQRIQDKFRHKSTHAIIVMDVDRYESLPKAQQWPAFPSKDVIVFSEEEEYCGDPRHSRTRICHSLSDIFEMTDDRIINPQEMIIIGSHRLFGLIIERCRAEIDEIFLFKLRTSFNGEQYFPHIDEEEWHKTGTELFPSDYDNRHEMKFVHYINTKQKSLID